MIKMIVSFDSDNEAETALRVNNAIESILEGKGRQTGIEITKKLQVYHTYTIEMQQCTTSTTVNGEDLLIIEEVKDHAAFWHSDMAKRLTVEKHLTKKGIKDVTAKIDRLAKAGKLQVVSRARGIQYLKA